jgi:hypothetical protein
MMMTALKPHSWKVSARALRACQPLHGIRHESGLAG